MVRMGRRPTISGDESVFEQVVGHDLRDDHVFGRVAGLVELGGEAHGPLADPGLDDLLDPGEGTTADEEDVRGVDLDVLLVRVFAPALRRHRRVGAFEDLQERLLHALAGDVTGDRGVVRFATGLVDLVDVDDAGLGALDVEVGGLDELEEDVLHVVAHIAGLGEGGGVGDRERHIQHPREGLRQVGLAGAGGPDHEDVRLLELDVVAAPDRAKRAAPTDDLLSDLAADAELADEEVAGMAILLLVAGHETTAKMLALGTMALLENRDQWDLLRERPELIAGGVEELLRYLTIIHTGLIRQAKTDFEFEGHQIKARDYVTVSVQTANRDEAHFIEPDKLDVTGDAKGHLTFGHGVHQCLGQQLARMEMRIAFSRLIARFPDLRLAVPAGEVPLVTGQSFYGVAELPVTW